MNVAPGRPAFPARVNFGWPVDICGQAAETEGERWISPRVRRDGTPAGNWTWPWF